VLACSLPLHDAGPRIRGICGHDPFAVPRLVFGLGLLWAWIIFQFPIYGNLMVLGIAYLPCPFLGLAHDRRRVLQVDKSLEVCARVCGPHGLSNADAALPLLRRASSPHGCDLIARFVNWGFSISDGSKFKGHRAVDRHSWLTASSEFPPRWLGADVMVVHRGGDHVRVARQVTGIQG